IPEASPGLTTKYLLEPYTSTHTVNNCITHHDSEHENASVGYENNLITLNTCNLLNVSGVKHNTRHVICNRNMNCSDTVNDSNNDKKFNENFFIYTQYSNDHCNIIITFN